MFMAWKEIKKSKARFIILGSIIFLISFLTFIISGLANGLSQDNAALIRNLPEGHFYMTEKANGTNTQSQIDAATQEQVLKDHSDAAALSIQMGFVNDAADKQYGVAFVTSTSSELFPQVKQGEIMLDASLQDKGIKVGDKLTNPQLDGSFKVVGFVQQKKFSHAPVAFIHSDEFKEMYRAKTLQMIFIPNDGDGYQVSGLQSFSNEAFLKTLASYKAEQLSLNMIVYFLIVISGLLFAIFFYMMNVQKIGLYGILKAIGVKTSTLFRMMWTQMVVITFISLAISIALSFTFNQFAPKGMPFSLSVASVLQLSALFLVIGFIGATISGVQIKRVEPLQAIQQGEM